MIFLIEPTGPWTIKPSIRTLSSVPTGSRVETFATRPGAGVGEGVSVGVGCESLSTIVMVADDGEPRFAPLGADRVTEKVSFPSKAESSAIGMTMFLVVSPAAKDKTPDTAV